MNWTDRVIPLPKEMEIATTKRVKAGEILLDICVGESPALQTAVGLLQKLALGREKAKFTIKLALTEDSESTIANRLRELPNSKQAYAIVPSSDSNGVNFIANTPTGLLYATRTYLQLVDSKQSLDPNDEVLLPLPTIVDWPDLGERGQWGGNSQSDLAWTSQWKLNHLEATVVVKQNADGYPEAHISSELLKEARSLGVGMVPYIPHLESISQSIGDLPEAAKAKPDPTKPLRSDYFPAICSSSPASVELIASWLESVMNAVDVTDICVWLSEESSPCFCKDCLGKEQFEMETILICKAFDLIKPKYPGLKLRLLLTQGSYPYNDRVLAVKPDDVGISYYDGGRTYDSSRKPMIYPLLEEYSRKGGWLGCYPQITNSWRSIFPWTAPQFLQCRGQEFADKKLDSITGYAVCSNRQHEFNVMAMAEYTWNSRGRSPEDFARAYATVMGLDNPSAFAKWAVLAGEAGWDLAESNLTLTLIYNPLMGLQGKAHADHRFEMAQFAVPGKLDEAIERAKDALAEAQNLGLPNAIRESQCCLAGLTAFKLIAGAHDLLILPELNQSQKAELSSKLDELDHITQVMASNHLAWAKDVEGISKPKTYGSRVYDTGLVLFRVCEALRNAAERFGIEDPRPEHRLHNLGSWSGVEFAETTAPVFEWDITDLVDRNGGDYAVGVNFIESAYHTDMLAIQALDESGNIVAEAENVPGDVGIWERWKDFPILIPKHDGKLTLRVKISGLPADAPADRRTCAATLGIRKGILR